MVVMMRMGEIKTHETFYNAQTAVKELTDNLNTIGQDQFLTVQRIGSISAQGVNAVMWDWQENKEVSAFFSFANSELVVFDEVD